jgi:hypothetical protein
MSIRQALSQKGAIIAVLFLQFITLVMFPLESFKSTTQEWWLPVLLAMFTLIAVVQILRKSTSVQPWNLISFAQGFNIISRLMMLLPHAMKNVNGAQVFDTAYVVLSLSSVVISAVLLWYFELPEVRLGMLR